MVEDHDFITGEVTKREATPEEIAAFELVNADEAAKRAAKAALIESRNAKLAALGLTLEELTA